MNFTVIWQLALLWALCFTVGLGTSCVLLPRNWQRERLLLAPIVGAGVLMLLAAASSDIGITMRTAAPIVCGSGLALSAAGAILSRRRSTPTAPRGTAALVHAAGVLAAAAAMVGVVFYHAWNAYSDAFTCFSIADYLQHHSYFMPAVPGAHEPILTQMALYQGGGFRMGSNFLLAFATALFRADYSFDLFNPVLGLGLWLAVPGFFVFCRRALFLGAAPAAVATMIYALHTGIPLANAVEGFLPQTWGMAFLLPLLALYVRDAAPGERGRRWMATGFFLGLLLLCYTEILPFVLVAVGLCFLMRIVFGRLRVWDALLSTAAPVGIAIVLAPFAAATFVHVMRVQSNAVVGWDVHVSLFNYIAMLSGYLSIAERVILAPGPLDALARIAAVAALITAGYAAFRAPRRIQRQVGCLSAVFVLALTWFGLCRVNPWNAAEVGQPWSTYKVVTYSFFLFTALWGYGLVACWRARGALRLVAVLQIAGVLVFFPVGVVTTARQAASQMQQFSGAPIDPVGEYERLPSLVASLPMDSPVNLIVPSVAEKHRELVAYFLRRPIIADWSDDNFIGQYMQPAATYDPTYPTLVFVRTGPHDIVAGMQLQSSVGLALANYTSGWYDEEHDGTSWWRWLEAAGNATLVLSRAGTVTVEGGLAIIGATRTMTISVAERPDQSSTYTSAEHWFAPFTAQPMHLPAGQYHVRFSVDGPAHIMGPSDTRDIRMGIRDLSWKFSPD